MRYILIMMMLPATCFGATKLAFIQSPNGERTAVDVSNPSKPVIVGVRHKGEWSHANLPKWAEWKKRKK